MSSIPERITADRAQLAAALKELRKRAFRSGSAAAKALDWSQPKMSKVENGRVLPSADDLDRVLDVVQASDRERAHITELATRLHSTIETNRTILRRGAAQKQAGIAEVEASASDLRYYAPSVLPGLLQAEGYMRTIFSLDLRGADLDAAIAARQRRQRVMDRDDIQLRFVIGEQALRWRFTTAPIMAEQLEHLLDMADRDDVSIGILPITAAVRDIPLHGFEMFDERLVTVGLEHAVVSVTEPADIAVYTRMYAGLERAARTGADGQAILQTALAALPGAARRKRSESHPRVEVFSNEGNTSERTTGHAKGPRPRRNAMTPARATTPATGDLTRPSVARMYDYYIGGTDNFPIDRATADQVIARVPSAVPALKANRSCMGRMVRYLAKQGIDQFIDLGTGLPTRGSVHLVAQQVNATAQVVYVDNDRSVLAHARAILARDQGVQVLKGDIREPQGILNAVRRQSMLDLSRPVAVLFIAILHFITTDEDAEGIVATFRDATAAGSYSAVTIATTDGTDPNERAAIEDIYRNATAPGVFRDRNQVERLFNGYELVEPGLVRAPDWRPDTVDTELQAGRNWFYTGVGRKS